MGVFLSRSLSIRHSTDLLPPRVWYLPAGTFSIRTTRNVYHVLHHHVTRDLASLDALTNAVAQSFSAPSIAPPRTLIEVALDFDRATDMLIRAQERSDTAAIAFYEAIRQQFISEQARIVSGNVHLDE